jgi:hypothetical protein
MSYAERRLFLWVLFLMGLLVLALSANVAYSTTLAPLRFDELAQESTAVARLRCLGSESRWDHGEIGTETRFEVLESEKGLLPGLVTVRMVGGRLGHLHSRVDGVPVFRTGEKVYLFLWRKQGEPYSVLAGRKGPFVLRSNRKQELKP